MVAPHLNFPKLLYASWQLGFLNHLPFDLSNLFAGVLERSDIKLVRVLNALPLYYGIYDEQRAWSEDERGAILKTEYPKKALVLRQSLSR